MKEDMKFTEESDGNSTCVYLLQEEGTDYHKVGITRKHPEQRVKHLQCGNPRSIKYVCRTPYMPCELALDVERTLIDVLRNNGRWNEEHGFISFNEEQMRAAENIQGGKEWIKHPPRKLQRIFSKINAVCRTPKPRSRRSLAYYLVDTV